MYKPLQNPLFLCYSLLPWTGKRNKEKTTPPQTKNPTPNKDCLFDYPTFMLNICLFSTMEISLPDLPSELAWIKNPFNQDQHHRYKGKVINEKGSEESSPQTLEGKFTSA